MFHHDAGEMSLLMVLQVLLTALVRIPLLDFHRSMLAVAARGWQTW